MLLKNNKKNHRYLLFKGSLLLTLLSFGFFVLANIVILFSTPSYILSNTEDVLPSLDAVLVLGAMVYSDGRLSTALQERTDAAISLRRAGKVRKILVSWDNRTTYYDEVTAIKNYLFSQDVPQEVVFLDYAWLDTYDSVYRAQYIFQVRSLLIPTQAFHVDRAVYLARNLWIEAYGVVVDGSRLPHIGRLQVREFFARGKAMRDILVGSSPRHFGDKIPIDGISNS